MNLVCMSEVSLMIVHLQNKHNFVSVQQLEQSKRFDVICVINWVLFQIICDTWKYISIHLILSSMFITDLVQSTRILNYIY